MATAYVILQTGAQEAAVQIRSSPAELAGWMATDLLPEVAANLDIVGVLAHSGERLPCTQEVAGAEPAGSILLFDFPTAVVVKFSYGHTVCSFLTEDGGQECMTL